MAQDVTQIAQRAHLKSNEALHSVGSIQTVETVHPQSAFLKPYSQETPRDQEVGFGRTTDYSTVTQVGLLQRNLFQKKTPSPPP